MIWGLVVVAWLALFALWVAMILDAARHAPAVYEDVGRSRGATIALVVITGWIGAIYYLAAIRRALTAAEHGYAPGAERSKPAAVDQSQRCLECGMSSIGPDETRCKNCGSERLAPST